MAVGDGVLHDRVLRAWDTGLFSVLELMNMVETQHDKCICKKGPPPLCFNCRMARIAVDRIAVSQGLPSVINHENGDFLKSKRKESSDGPRS